MVQITKENGMQSAGVPFAWVEVQYPDKAQWDETGFYDMVEQHVAALREQYREYVRADVLPVLLPQRGDVLLYHIVEACLIPLRLVRVLYLDPCKRDACALHTILFCDLYHV